MLANHRLCKVWRGQYTLFALFMTVITIVAYSRIYPILRSVIDETTPQMQDSEAMLLALSPLIILFFILYGALWYVVPHREEKY